jgi:hypothetical protein
MQVLVGYKTIDGYPMTDIDIATNICCLMIFTMIFIYGILIAIKFWKYRTYQTGLFYVMALLCLVSKSIYFALRFIYFNSYCILLMHVIPGLFSLSVVISQTIVYAVLTVELSFFIKKRAKDA